MNSSDPIAAAFAHTHTAILLLDKATGCIVDANPAFFQLCGRPRAQVVGRAFWAPPLIADAEAGAEVFHHLLAGGSVDRAELPMETGDGSFVLIEVSGQEGLPGIVQLDVTDVTRRAGDRIAARIDAQRHLAVRVASEFTAMQHALQAAGDMLTNCARLGQATYQESDEVQQAAGRAGAIARELQACGEQLALDATAVHLNDLVAAMQPDLQRLLGQDIRIVLDLSPDAAQITADPAQLRQAILKLAANSREAMPRGGVFRIQIRNAPKDDPALGAADGSYVMLAIGDNGPGLDEESWAHLYEPFFTTKAPGKRGLGLAAVHGIVRQSGGRLWAHSEPGQGASFRIYLPVSEAAPVAKQRVAPSILLMEKNDGLRAVMTGILKNRGYRVLAAPPSDGTPDLLIDEPGSNLPPRLARKKVTLSKPFELETLLTKVQDSLTDNLLRQ